jgi:hypothetical protein
MQIARVMHDPASQESTTPNRACRHWPHPAIEWCFRHIDAALSYAAWRLEEREEPLVVE